MRFLPLLALAVLLTVPAADAWLMQGFVTVEVQVFDSDGNVTPCVGIETSGGGFPIDNHSGLIIYTGTQAPRGFAGYKQNGDCPS